MLQPTYPHEPQPSNDDPDSVMWHVSAQVLQPSVLGLAAALVALGLLFASLRHLRQTRRAPPERRP